jgi:hypothetical protein
MSKAIAPGEGASTLRASVAGAIVAGIDASRAAVEIASERIPGARFLVGDMQFLPYDEESF